MEDVSYFLEGIDVRKVVRETLDDPDVTRDHKKNKSRKWYFKQFCHPIGALHNDRETKWLAVLATKRTTRRRRKLVTSYPVEDPDAVQS